MNINHSRNCNLGGLIGNDDNFMNYDILVLFRPFGVANDPTYSHAIRHVNTGLCTLTIYTHGTFLNIFKVHIIENKYCAVSCVYL